MLILAADPGLSGAICLLDAADGRLLELENLPTRPNGSAGAVQREISGVQMSQLLDQWSRKHDFARRSLLGVVERLQPFGQGRANTMMSMGYTEGVVVTLIEQRCGHLVRVSPQRWKRTFGLVSKGDEKVGKAESVNIARKLYGAQLGAQLRHDKAEAVLIAHWARQTQYEKAAA